MKPPVHDASARQRSGEPFSGLGANDARRDRLCNRDRAEVDGEIARLVDRSTQELRRAWRTMYHTRPPLGLSCDLPSQLRRASWPSGAISIGCRPRTFLPSKPPTLPEPDSIWPSVTASRPAGQSLCPIARVMSELQSGSCLLAFRCRLCFEPVGPLHLQLLR